MEQEKLACKVINSNPCIVVNPTAIPAVLAKPEFLWRPEATPYMDNTNH